MLAPLREPQGSLRAPGVLREAGEYPGAGDLDLVCSIRLAGRVEAADRAGERRWAVQFEFAAAACEVNSFGRPRPSSSNSAANRRSARQIPVSENP